MRKIAWVGLLVLTLMPFATHGLPSELTRGSPSSGFVRYATFTVWFDGMNTRNETRQNAEVTMVGVTGDRWWVAFPPSGRVMSEPQSPPPKTPYPEIVRSQFARLTQTNATNLGEEVVNNLPCWKYSVKVKRRRPGPTEEITSTNYFLANPDFPLLVRITDHLPSDVLELKLNCPVPKDLFLCPADLKPTRPFNLRGRFTVEVRETRSAPELGWSSVATNILTSDGETVRKSYTQILNETDGKTSTFGPKVETNSLIPGVAALNYPLACPFWNTARKIGEEKVLGFNTEVYQSIPPAQEFYWVVDHPAMGTFSARRAILGENGQTETNEIVRLEIDGAGTR